MIIDSEKDVTKVVLDEYKRIKNPRLREIMAALIRHLHEFAREVKLTDEEFHAACATIIGVVVLLSFILLTVVFRSLVIPATAAVMNLLSIGAALGAVVAVFQWGHGAHLMGVGKGGPVEAFGLHGRSTGFPSVPKMSVPKLPPRLNLTGIV